MTDTVISIGSGVRIEDFLPLGVIGIPGKIVRKCWRGRAVDFDDIDSVRYLAEGAFAP